MANYRSSCRQAQELSIFDDQVRRIRAAYAHGSRPEVEGQIHSWLNEG